MRHRKIRSKLSMMAAHRNAMLRNTVKNLFKRQQITTTRARAKVARRMAEKLITLAKNDSVSARRRAYDLFTDRDMVARLFKEISPLFKTRTSGFTRIIPLGFRRGDGADLCILELTEKIVVPEKQPRKKARSAKAGETQAPKSKAEGGKEAKKPKEEDRKPAGEESKIKHIPKSKPTLTEEKRAEKAKSEDRKAAEQRGFMKNIRGLFRKRGDR